MVKEYKPYEEKISREEELNSLLCGDDISSQIIEVINSDGMPEILLCSIQNLLKENKISIIFVLKLCLNLTITTDEFYYEIFTIINSYILENENADF